MTDFTVGMRGAYSEIKKFCDSNSDVCVRVPGDTFTVQDCTHARLSFKNGTTESQVAEFFKTIPSIEVFRIDKAQCCHTKF